MATVCGCYYIVWSRTHNAKKCLPQVNISAHTTILSTASRTVLSQTFINPSPTLEVPGCKYVFPLYDGVSVVGFTCDVGSRTITGIVKEKARAKGIYDEAVARGETAGLLEQGPASDVFTTSLGNIPAGGKLSVKITYIEELKHDMGADGLRFTLPSTISPRYSDAEVETIERRSTVSTGGLAITVDISMETDSALQEVRSPSHPIAVTLGRISTATSEAHHPSRASATLSLNTSALSKDFVLEILHQDSGKPKALLETRPTLKGQRALMTTLVPRTSIQASKPEVIFVADQSGSMSGKPTYTLVAALRVFLKSLPVGIKFNICFFGSSHTFLFKKSQEYDQNSLAKAFEALEGLGGTMGGTETLSAVKASIQSRDPDENLSVILATDGNIWQQQGLFDYLNASVSQSKKILRVFALGIGGSVASALIEGVAKAGNGFAQFVTNGEKLDKKVVRMLKGALTPDSGSYTMEVQYQKDEDNDDFVLVERVTDSLRVMMIDENDRNDTPNAQLSRELTASVQADRGLRGDITDQIPSISMPKVLQTPQAIPPLYPFSRTTVYILMSPSTSQATPKSVILRGNSLDDPFEMEIPVEVFPHPSETIHQLAAKRAVSEFEEGRGWLVYSKDDNGTLIKEKYGDKFKSMVEHEAVRLGVEYQIAGKYTSFVAVESTKDSTNGTNGSLVDNIASPEIGITKAIPRPGDSRLSASNMTPFSNSIRFPAVYRSSPAPSGGHNRTNQAARMSTGGMAPRKQLASKAAPSSPSSPSKKRRVSSPEVEGRGVASRTVQRQVAMAVDGGDDERAPPVRGPRSAGASLVMSPYTAMQQGEPGRAKYEVSTPRNHATTYISTPHARQASTAPPVEQKDPLQELIALQTFEGFWEYDARLLNIVGLASAQDKVPEGLRLRLWATIIAVSFMEKKMSDDEETWEMIVHKAKGWLRSVGVDGGEKAGWWWKWAGDLVEGKRSEDSNNLA